jgi:hypothetical protein
MQFDLYNILILGRVTIPKNVINGYNKNTAIDALVREAQQAESKADFIHKLAIALKEATVG